MKNSFFQSNNQNSKFIGNSIWLIIALPPLLKTKSMSQGCFLDLVAGIPIAMLMLCYNITLIDEFNARH